MADDRADGPLGPLLDRSPLPYAILDRQHRVLRANPAWASALHATSDALTGRTLAEAGVHAHVCDVFAKPVEEAFLTAQPQAFEFDGPPDRSLRILLARVAPLGDHALVTLEDVTESHALRHSQAEAVERAQEARRLAEESAWRGRVLALVAGFLEEDLQPDEVLQRLARIVVPDLADVCIVEAPDATGVMRIVATAADAPLHEDALRALHGAPAPDEATILPVRVHHGVAIPLATRARSHGQMRLWFTRAYRRHRPDEIAFAEQLGRRAAVALEHARRLADAADAQRDANQARADAERATDRASVLAGASAAVATARDAREVAAALADACVPRLAESALVDVLRADGTLERAGIAHADAAKQATLRDLVARRPPDVVGLPRILATVGSGILMQDVGEAERAAWAGEGAQAEIMRLLAPRTYLVVPLVASGRVFGLLSLSSSLPTRRFGAEELALARDLAARAAVALQRMDAATSADAAQHDQEDSRAVLDILTARRGLAYALLDSRMRFVRVSDALARLHGRTAESHVGREAREAAPDLAEAYLPLVRAAIARGQSTTNHVAQSPRGLLVLSAYPVRTSQGPGALLVVDE